MDACTPAFEELARQVGGIACRDVGLVTLRSPFSLGNGTLPVIELLLVVGAAAGLVHALRWKRTHGDATNLVVWWSGILCLFLIEPIAYFPEWFGLEDSVGGPRRATAPAPGRSGRRDGAAAASHDVAPASEGGLERVDQHRRAALYGSPCGHPRLLRC